MAVGLIAGLIGCGLEESGVGTGDSDDGGHGMTQDAIGVLDGPSRDLDGTVSDGPSRPDSPFIDAPMDARLDGASKDAGHDAAHEGGGADAPLDDAKEEAEASVDAGNITITGGPYTLEDEGAGLCSMNDDTPTSFTLDNDRSAPIELDWMSFGPACTEVKYATVAPGGSYPQPTYATHVWIVKDNTTKAFLDEFVLGGAGPYTVTVH
jgi:hypothetical protein